MAGRSYEHGVAIELDADGYLHGTYGGCSCWGVWCLCWGRMPGCYRHTLRVTDTAQWVKLNDNHTIQPFFEKSVYLCTGW